MRRRRHLQRGYDNSLSSARECAACAHWEHFDKHDRERRKQLVAEWKRREEEKLDAGSSSGSSEPEEILFRSPKKYCFCARRWRHVCTQGVTPSHGDVCRILLET